MASKKLKLSVFLREFAELQYSEKTGKRRSNATMATYESITCWYEKKVFTRTYDINLLAFDLSGRRGVALASMKKEYEKLANRVKKLSSTSSDNTLKIRLDLINWALAKAEKDYNIRTAREYFMHTASDNEVIVIDDSLHILTAKKAVETLENEDVKGHLYLGALVYLMITLTSARISDLKKWRFSENLVYSRANSQYLLVFKNKKVKYGITEIPIPERVSKVLTYQEHVSSDYVFMCRSVVHMRNCFREFLKSIPEYHEEAVAVKNISDGSTQTSKKKLYDYYSPHKVRATFITQMVEQGVDFETIMSFSGHKSLNTLLKRYTKVSQAHRKSKYNNYISSVI